ncbi:MAG: LuxR C-terminal-related transcriptional regulator [Polyangiaceae bacterium]
MKSGAEILEIIEAIYREEKSDRAWVEGILEAAKPSLDVGSGLVGIPFEARPEGLHVPWAVVHGAAPNIKASFITDVLDTARDDREVSEVYRSAACATGSEAGMTKKRGWKMLEERGVMDFLAVNSVDTTGRGMLIGALLPKVSKIPAKRRARFQRVAAHLGIGQRYRTLMKIDNRAEAIFSANAKLLHAEGDATTNSARSALTQAVIALDRARGKLRSIDPDGALEAWRGLVDARWSLVDQFENDGKRFIVARENEPISPPLPNLSKRERQIVGYLVAGHTSKLIAYELGISDSTVRVLIHRAMQRLKVKTRSGLAAAFIAAMTPA